uniref:Uncharacterized protein n=1 Tax=Parascaris equorum TaxID=6256 RepID=A0A914RFK9_PAREQ
MYSNSVQKCHGADLQQSGEVSFNFSLDRVERAVSFMVHGLPYAEQDHERYFGSFEQPSGLVPVRRDAAEGGAFDPSLSFVDRAMDEIPKTIPVPEQAVQIAQITGR